ncbi:hypothetical protein MRB53_012297 [Persea americana]|uniref:Uncharacterized protein n=1 Tax=Persea americana TaxID=3435 RepID=A0ACC2LXA9_PERAE|nr:hypothetical protein MRB53_012297 [Persea americana]
MNTDDLSADGAMAHLQNDPGPPMRQRGVYLDWIHGRLPPISCLLPSPPRALAAAIISSSSPLLSFPSSSLHLFSSSFPSSSLLSPSFSPPPPLSSVFPTSFSFPSCFLFISFPLV